MDIECDYHYYVTGVSKGANTIIIMLFQVHFVHKKEKFDSLGESLASNESDALAAKGFFFKVRQLLHLFLMFYISSFAVTAFVTSIGRG